MNLWNLAQEKALATIDKKHLTKTELLKKDSQGNTVVHYISEESELKLIPAEFFTEETLLTKNSINLTILHNLAYCHNLHLINPELLTEKNLTLQDSYGDTVLFYATLNGDLTQIPQERLNKNTILIKNQTGNTVLEKIVNRKWLHLLTNKTIAEIPLETLVDANYEHHRNPKVGIPENELKTLHQKAKITYAKELISKTKKGPNEIPRIT
jgi:ankyrin repeat protein